jgi:hypothetical protein
MDMSDTDTGTDETATDEAGAADTEAHDAAPHDAVGETVAKVREYLFPFDHVEIDADGTASLTYGSARVVVSVSVFDEDQSLVQVSAMCVTGAKPSPELYQHVASFQSQIGHLSVNEQDDGTVCIEYSHGLLGEFLNPAELRLTVIAVALLADQIDDDLAARFGGTVHDAAANTAAD